MATDEVCTQFSDDDRNRKTAGSLDAPIADSAELETAGSETAAATAGGTSSEPARMDAYEQSLRYLYSQINYEKIAQPPYVRDNYRLDRMRSLLRLLGDPQLKYKVVHVAGTKGKGTVSNLIAASLCENGLRTGLYTSPHLVKLEERFSVSGVNASADEVVHLVQRVQIAANELEASGGGKATFFELTTAMGMLHFADHACEFAVLEVGLGGRLDSTNVCAPSICVITSISLDHQKLLGDTIGEIAGEKAGIVKPGIPVVASARHPEAQTVFEQVCRSRRSPLTLIDRDFSFEWTLLEDRSCVQFRNSPDPLDPCKTTSNEAADNEAADNGLGGGSVEFRNGDGRSHVAVRFDQPKSLSPEWQVSQDWNIAAWQVDLLGSHQAENVAAAIATMALLQKVDSRIGVEATRRAIAKCQPAARMQVVGERPTRIIDTAHNVASIAAGLNAIAEHFDRQEIVCLFATSSDKDYRGMITRLLKRCHTVVLTEYQNNPRALKLEQLHEIALELNAAGNCRILVEAVPEDAWRRCVEIAGTEQVLYAAGSFFLAAELLVIDELISPPLG